MTEVKQLNPDTFVAFSYPPDTITITDQAHIELQPQSFLHRRRDRVPALQTDLRRQRRRRDGPGRLERRAPESKAYLKRHVAMTGQEPDRWASPVTYASLQMLQQAIERVGAIDRAAAIKELQTGTFETILGPVKLENNLYKENWWVGQWQHGEFYGVTPASLPGAHEYCSRSRPGMSTERPSLRARSAARQGFGPSINWSSCLTCASKIAIETWIFGSRGWNCGSSEVGS